MIRTLSFFAAAAAPLAATPALAQDAGAPSGVSQADLDRDTVTIGVAGAYVPDYQGSNDYRFVPAPAAIGSVDGFNFTLLGNRASVDLIRDKPGPGIDVQLGPIAVVNFNRTDHKSIDDPRVAALPERDTAIELGGYEAKGFGPAEWQTVARVTALFCRRFKIPVQASRGDRPGIARHYDLGIRGGGHHDPTLSTVTWAKFLMSVAGELKKGDFPDSWGRL